MFPYLRIGPILIQMSLLALLLGLWIGLWLVEHESKMLNLNPSAIGRMILYSLVAGLIGARLGYALQFPSLYLSNPLGLIALTPTTLSPLMGLVVGLFTSMIVIERKGLPIRPTLDAIAPGLAFFMVLVGLSHILSGDAYGAPARVPWAVRLWNEYRHPSQFYESFIALMILAVIRQRFPKPEGTGLNFLLTVALSSASRIFLEAFRGDSVFWPGGFREAQVVSLIVMAISFYWIRKWNNSNSTSDVTLNRRG